MQASWLLLLLLVPFISCLPKEYEPLRDVVHLVVSKLSPLTGTSAKFTTFGMSECTVKPKISQGQMDSICTGSCLDFLKSKADALQKCIENNMSGDECQGLLASVQNKCEDIIKILVPSVDSAQCKLKTSQQSCCSDPQCSWISSDELKPTSKFSVLANSDPFSDFKLSDALKLVCSKSDSNKYCVPSLLDAATEEMCKETDDMTGVLDVVCGGCLQRVMEVISIPQVSALGKLVCSNDNGTYCFVGKDLKSPQNDLSDAIKDPLKLKAKCQGKCPPNVLLTETVHFLKSMGPDVDSKVIDLMSNMSQLICLKDDVTDDLCFSKISQIFSCRDPSKCDMCSELQKRTGPNSDCCPRAVLSVLKANDANSYSFVSQTLRSACNINYPEGMCAPYGQKIQKSVTINADCQLLTKNADKYKKLVTRDLESDFHCVGCIVDVKLKCASSSSSKFSMLSTQSTTVDYTVQGQNNQQSEQYAAQSSTALSGKNSLIETTTAAKKDQQTTTQSNGAYTIGPVLCVTMAIFGAMLML